MRGVINLGFIQIHLYSICLIVGMLVASFLIIREAKRHGYKENVITDLLFYTILGGIVGARIYYCLFNLDYYKDIISIFKVWEGGLAIHGGIIGGLLASFVFCKKKKLNYLLILDFVVVGLIIAQAIGRWGNFFNGEAHGPVTDVSVLNGLYLPKFIIDGMFIDGNYYLPTFLYESIWCVLGFVIMFVFRHKKWNKIGYLTGFYLIWYSIGRFVIESMRTDSLMFLSFKAAQLVSILMIIIGITLIIYSSYKKLYYNEGDSNA